MLMFVNSNQEKQEDRHASMSLQESFCSRPGGPQFAEIKRIEIQFQAPASSRVTMHTIDREEKTFTSEKLVRVSEFIAGLENVCVLEGWNGVLTRRSPLPLWYPRRPLQDITAVLNSAPTAAQETPIAKKETKKAQMVEPHGHIPDLRGPLCRPRTPKIPEKSKSSVASVDARSAVLRKGFR